MKRRKGPTYVTNLTRYTETIREIRSLTSGEDGDFLSNFDDRLKTTNKRYGRTELNGLNR